MLATNMPKILLVGGGLTSSLTASLLHQKLNQEGNHVDISIWDKAKGTGGRMSTSRSPNDGKCTVDLGAQYISCTPQYQATHKSYYDELLAAGILEPLTQSISNVKEYELGTSHYVAPNGISSLVKYFFNKSGIQPSFDHHISKIDLMDDKWCVSTLKGKSEMFDAVILTMPVPQVLDMKGTITNVLDKNSDVKRKLQQVEYSSRYALGLFYEEGTSLNLPFSASYLNNDPVFRFIAVDNVKRNKPELPPSVVLHTSIPFGVNHIDITVQEVEPILMKALKESFPELPLPSAVKCQKWRFSQVSKSYTGQPGVVEISNKPTLLVGGDGFTHSNFDGCVSSAESIIKAMMF